MDIPPLATPATNLLTIFGCGFFSVFMLGFQSRNVNHLNYKWAAVSSFAIGLSSLYLWKHLLVGGLVEGIVYGTSGALAITSSMYIHERFIKRGGSQS
jgi:O-antigen/teichoic acid export membrane protein